METSRRRSLTEALLVWFVAVAAASLLFHLRSLSPVLAHNLMAFTSAILLYLPARVLWVRRESFDFFERTRGALLNSLKWTLYVSLLIFPILALLNHFYQAIPIEIKAFGTGFWKLESHYVSAPSNLSLVKTFFFHLVMVALPEEFFFRGYLLKRLKEVFTDRIDFWGVKIGWAFFLTAFLFALSHSLIVVRWWHFAIFFPALVFGWSRDKTGAITASILFHALSNTFAAWVALHYQVIK